jgi:hypothetical protein
MSATSPHPRQNLNIALGYDELAGIA